MNLDLHTITQTLEPQNFAAYRSGLFTIFVTTGSLMVTALGLFVTRVHDLMNKKEALQADGDLFDLFPGIQFTLPLRQAVLRTRKAAGVSFATALLELGLGSSSWSAAPLVAIALAVAAVVYVALSVDVLLLGYTAWLDRLDVIHREQVKRRAL